MVKKAQKESVKQEFDHWSLNRSNERSTKPKSIKPSPKPKANEELKVSEPMTSVWVQHFFCHLSGTSDASGWPGAFCTLKTWLNALRHANTHFIGWPHLVCKQLSRTSTQSNFSWSWRNVVQVTTAIVSFYNAQFDLILSFFLPVFQAFLSRFFPLFLFVLSTLPLNLKTCNHFSLLSLPLIFQTHLPHVSYFFPLLPCLISIQTDCAVVQSQWMTACVPLAWIDVD